MAPGTGVKTPVPRTRTGCLTCRKGKVKCDEAKPNCSRCIRLQRECYWSPDLAIVPIKSRQVSSTKMPSPLSSLSGQNFVIEFPNVDRATVPYIHHFITFCSRFLAFTNDSECNPFQEEMVPLASSSPALLHSMAALAAGHLARSHPKVHEVTAANHYARALRELNATLSDNTIARLDSTLGACLMLCVYEISHSENCLWLGHLQGARDLILFRGGPRTDDFLVQFFSYLDISGSLASGTGPLLQGNYWLEEGPNQEKSSTKRTWPYYDGEAVMTNVFQRMMIHMAKLSKLSAESMSDQGIQHPEMITEKADQIGHELRSWWQSCPSKLKDQSNYWRTQTRECKLTVAETLEEEAFSSTKSCYSGCIIYLNHILDPFGRSPQSEELVAAITNILETGRECPEGYGLEMGYYWGLFMAGIAIFNDEVAESLIRHKLKGDSTGSIYHAERALELLEVLWKRQHQYGTKFDWRQVQIQMGIQVFILA